MNFVCQLVDFSCVLLGEKLSLVKALKLHLLILRLKCRPLLFWIFFGVTRELFCDLLCTFSEDGRLKR